MVKGNPREPKGAWASACSLPTVVIFFCAVLLWGALSLRRTGDLPVIIHSFDTALQHHSVELEHQQEALTGADLMPGQEQQQPEQQLYEQHLVADVPSYGGPPYILPKLIHQTVKDKNAMSCEVQQSIQTWIDMNPGYTHILYDDADLLHFVKQHYPELVDVYQGLPSNIERTDTWRYLVLHKLGGVYADSDVQCMQPISTWNADNGFDAALMVGIAKRNMKTGDTFEFNQFVIAAMPGHPVLASMPFIIAGNLAHTFLKGVNPSAHGRKHDNQILMRTGPKAFTSALRNYATRVDAPWPVNSTLADQQGGVLFGSVRAMPKFVFGAGWDTLDHNMTCAEVKKHLRPEALICHQFFGTWKDRPEEQLKQRTFTYGHCIKGSSSSSIPASHEGTDASTAAAAAAADAEPASHEVADAAVGTDTTTVTMASSTGNAETTEREVRYTTENGGEVVRYTTDSGGEVVQYNTDNLDMGATAAGIADEHDAAAAAATEHLRGRRGHRLHRTHGRDNMF